MMTRVKYKEGDWFVVPLRKGGYALGLVARANRDGVLLGYFFGPKRTALPTLEDVASLRPSDVTLIQKFGHLGLTNAKWLMLGSLVSWNRAEWRVPAFLRHEELSGRTLRVFYDDDDPNAVVREEVVDARMHPADPRDGLLGAGAVEKLLTMRLDPDRVRL